MCPRSGAPVRELPQSPGFSHHGSILTCLNHFPRVGYHLDGPQCNLSAAIAFARGGGREQRRRSGMAVCVFLCRICQKAVTQTMQRLPRGCKSLTAAVKKRRRKKKTHHPYAIITPNDKRCLVSRWIMLMLVACAHHGTTISALNCQSPSPCVQTPHMLWPLPHAKQLCVSGRLAGTLMVQSNPPP